MSGEYISHLFFLWGTHARSAQHFLRLPLPLDSVTHCRQGHTLSNRQSRALLLLRCAKAFAHLLGNRLGSQDLELGGLLLARLVALLVHDGVALLVQDLLPRQQRHVLELLRLIPLLVNRFC